MKAPTTQTEAVRHLTEDLRREGRHAAAALLASGARAQAGAIVAELTARSPVDPVTCEMVRAWGARHDGAILAGYQALYAPETDSDAEVALAAMAAARVETGLSRDLARIDRAMARLASLSRTWQRTGRGIGERDALDEIEEILAGLDAMPAAEEVRS